MMFGAMYAAKNIRLGLSQRASAESGANKLLTDGPLT